MQSGAAPYNNTLGRTYRLGMMHGMTACGVHAGVMTGMVPVSYVHDSEGAAFAYANAVTERAKSTELANTAT